MKKFLIFLVSIVVVVCVGLTTYYFMRNNEIITIKTKEIYCNAGDSIPLATLGISMEKKNISKKTTFDYNAGGEEVTKFIKYEKESDSFVVSNENAGEVTLVISTSNKKYPDFKIKVHIGNGSIENPYYIFNESELSRIGNVYRLDKCYKLMNNITLTPEFKAIGYNETTSTWEGFNGTFNGQGYSIKGLNLNDVETSSIGLFSKLNASAKVENLIIENATISGDYNYAGVLAGVVDGNVEKVVIKNSTITNTSTNSQIGALAGSYTGDTLKLSYADNVVINVGDEETTSSSVVGGLLGSVDQATVQACYTNNVTINVVKSNAVAGGLVGKLLIGTETGSIQQAYANTQSTYANYGAFVGEIKTVAGFEAENANMLRHLIGNIAVVYGVASGATIEDAQLVKVYDNTFFKNETFVDRSAFFDKDSAMYLIRGYASAGEMISTNEYVYYAIDMNTITEWDTTYVWDVSGNHLPVLRMGSIYPAAPSGEYFRRDLEEKPLGNKETFVDLFSSNVENQNIKLLDDVDLTNGWTPVSVKNTTIDGNNKTITINLNNAVENNLGLFTTVDNSTIKNLNIIVTGVSAKATNAGALAGVITSTDKLTTSSIENVTITYQGFENPAITNFGGLAGSVNKAVINNVAVAGLNISKDAAITNAGALVGVAGENAQIKNSKVENSTVYALQNIGGVVAVNSGAITNITGNVKVKSNSAAANIVVGGVVANNTGSIDNAKLTTNITIEKFSDKTNVGGVAGNNSGSISNVTILGDSIEVTYNTTEAIINVGGVVASNSGYIENVVNSVKNVGTYHVGANHYVGGVVAINSGKIKKVVTESNLFGNKVSGVVAIMDTVSATIDQVVVGNYNEETKTLSQNSISADKYVAGVSVEFYAGTITNVQAASTINGKTSSTRSSLVALIFPYGATLKNATIDSSFAGYGERYRETWTDFGVYSNKAEFGMQDIGTDARFNVYKYDAVHGCMQSVVINGANAGVANAKAAMGNAFLGFAKDYADTAESSFIKVVDQFKDASQFSGKFTFVCAIDTTTIFKHEATKELTFNIGGVWKENKGISLKFLDDIFAK